MQVYPYLIRTSQITIQTPAKDAETAIQLVMDAERCPRSAILSVERLGTTIRL
jgi:hypothetical protein